MSKILRWVAPIAAAGTLIAMAAGTAQAASQSGYGVTIGATGTAPSSVHGKTYGYALAAYKAKGKDTGTISGTVSGAAAGDAVTLLAKPFKARSFAATGQSTTLAAAGTSAYSFTVTPSLATAYEVQVSTGTIVDVTSATATVYVEDGGHGGKLHERCSRTSCTYAYPVYTTFPASAYRTESKKRVYFYLAQWRSSKHPATWFYLAKKDKASKVKRINSGEFEQTLTWYITVSAGHYFIPQACTRDSESTDGLGLPGRHGCGDKRVSIRDGLTYLG
jgi:hypothetical protein